MQIYRNATDGRAIITAPQTVLPYGDTIDIKAVDSEGNTLHVFEQVGRVKEGFAVKLPWSLTREDSRFFVDWNFVYDEFGQDKTFYERTEVEVVTPILPIQEIIKITEWTDAYDIQDLERRVRFAIQAYCGTTFGKFRGTIPVTGTGDSKLNLPLPILQVASPRDLVVYGGGFMLGAPQGAYQGGIKSAPPDEVLDNYFSGAPITAPGRYRNVHFRDDVKYNITGLWGYHDVPEDVRQAARLLIADYSCDESLWRDRYINAIKAGDWRIDFNGEAFQGTGNVVADQILAAYRRTSLVIV